MDHDWARGSKEMKRVRNAFRWRGVQIAAGVCLALTGAVLLLPAAAANADGNSTIHVVLDGRTVNLPTPPQLTGGHVFLPLRDLAAALELAVRWDPTTDTVYLGSGAPALATGATAIPLDAPVRSPSTPAGSAFTYNGLRYETTGLVARPYPGDQNNSGTYWIVSYSITDTSSTPFSVPASEVPVLFGPNGSQIAADSTLGGTAPSVVNPGITFSTYEVFNVPSSAVPSDYALGFAPTQTVGSQSYFGTPLKMSLPPNSSSTDKTPVGASYDLENVFSNANTHNLTSEQVLTITDTMHTTAIAPDLTKPSFKPDTSFLIVNFTLKNTTSGDINIAASDFTLDYNCEMSITPYNISYLPGYVQATGLQAQGGVTVLTGSTFSGSLLFEIPAGTPTTNPQLQFSANGQTRVVTLTPCQSGACPPVLG